VSSDTNNTTPDWEYIKKQGMRVNKHLHNHYNDLAHRAACDICMAFFIGEQYSKLTDEQKQ
jgi:hypothetical protein